MKTQSGKNLAVYWLPLCEDRDRNTSIFACCMPYLQVDLGTAHDMELVLDNPPVRAGPLSMRSGPCTGRGMHLLALVKVLPIYAPRVCRCMSIEECWFVLCTSSAEVRFVH